MYEYIASSEKRRAPRLILLFFLGGMALMLLPSVLSVPFQWAFQLVGLCLFTAAVYLVTRYMTKSFLYRVFPDDDGRMDFSVTELRGKTRCMVCRIGLADIREAVMVDARSKEEMAEVKKRIKAEKLRCYDYCSDLSPTLSCYLFVREQSGEPLVIRIMPDEKLFKLLSGEEA